MSDIKYYGVVKTTFSVWQAREMVLCVEIVQLSLKRMSEKLVNFLSSRKNFSVNLIREVGLFLGLNMQISHLIKKLVQGFRTISYESWFGDNGYHLQLTGMMLEVIECVQKDEVLFSQAAAACKIKCTCT